MTHHRRHLLVVDSERAPCPAEPRLHLVRNHQHAVLGAQLPHPAQVPGRRHHHARLALDGLKHEGAHVWVGGQRRVERLQVAVRDEVHVAQEGTEAFAAARVARRRAGRERAAPEVALAKEHCRLVVRHALDVVSPPPRELDGGLAALDSRVHGEHAVEAEEVGHELRVLAEHGVVEGARRERQLGGLRVERLEDRRVGVTLVDRRVGREEVKVARAVHVPHVHALPALEDHWQRRIVVCAVSLLEADEPRRGSGGRGGGAARAQQPRPEPERSS